MSHPHIPITDPLSDPLEAAELELEAWERGYAAAESDRKWRVAGLLLALGCGLVLGFLAATAIASAAPRSAPEGAATPPASTGAPPSDDTRTGSSQPEVAGMGGRGTRPSDDLGGAPSTDVEIGTAMESGIIAFADPSFGDRYLAIPSGPGYRVRICSGSGAVCLDRISTDAGPALFRQREGRIADVSFVDFATLCGCDPRIPGTMVATIENLGPTVTPPATETEP